MKLVVPVTKAVRPEIMPQVDHDACDPDPRADFLEDQVTRDLEQEIAEEENPGTPAVDVGAEAEILVHGERSEGDVATVDIGDAIG